MAAYLYSIGDDLGNTEIKYYSWFIDEGNEAHGDFLVEVVENSGLQLPTTSSWVRNLRKDKLHLSLQQSTYPKRTS
jgi:hypothetical protein